MLKVLHCSQRLVPYAGHVVTADGDVMQHVTAPATSQLKESTAPDSDKALQTAWEHRAGSRMLLSEWLQKNKLQACDLGGGKGSVLVHPDGRICKMKGSRSYVAGDMQEQVRLVIRD